MMKMLPIVHRVCVADQTFLFAGQVFVGCRNVLTQSTVYFVSLYAPGAEQDWTDGYRFPNGP